MKKFFAVLAAFLVLAAVLPAARAELPEPDLDLSVMPASISYSQMVNMLKSPEEYVGKTVKVSGVFNYSEARGRGVIIVADRTMCCETSIDFARADPAVYPDDYPALYSRITLFGTFMPCEGEEGVYILSDAVIIDP